MANSKQEYQFQSIQQGISLDDAVEWISDNLEPGEVFDLAELNDWARNNGFVEDLED